MNTTLATSRAPRRRSATPWPVRLLLVAAILFGIWVDISTDAANGDNQTMANPTRTTLLGLPDSNSLATDVVRTLASRRS